MFTIRDSCGDLLHFDDYGSEQALVLEGMGCRLRVVIVYVEPVRVVFGGDVHDDVAEEPGDRYGDAADEVQEG